LIGHVQALYPICRSITGPGLRSTLQYIGNYVPLRITEVPSGTEVLDWTIPEEWRVHGATLEDLDGRKLVDFADHNLHLLQYSMPVDAVVSRGELDAHLFSLPDQPDVIPYRTAYYSRSWGFCLPHALRERLTDPAYKVRIDTEFRAGSLSYGEVVLPGETEEEVLFSAHCCHPSLANDNLSGIAVAIEVARALMQHKRRFTYRFLFAPGTIGAIAWLHANKSQVHRVSHGLVLTCLGDDNPPTYKRSRQGTARIDRYVEYVLRDEGIGDRLLAFEPTGYDERQFCSPGFNLPVGCLSRSPGGTFAEYHTSSDDLSFMRPAALSDSVRVLLRIVAMIEDDVTCHSTQPYGEPQLGRRGLLPLRFENHETQFDTLTMMWVLNLADGRHSILDMAERSGRPFGALSAAAQRLREAGLLTGHCVEAPGTITACASAAS
jgi:aminopeptidase-like protein